MSVSHISGASRPARRLETGWLVARGRVESAADDRVVWHPADGPAPVHAVLDLTESADVSSWTYRLTFDAPELEGRRSRLGFDGLATIASVRLNDQPLFDARNMFRRYEHDLLPGMLRASRNELRVHVDALNDHLDTPRRARPRWRAPMVAHQQLRWFRTSLLGRTPGWSPMRPVVGPWAPVWLRDADTAGPVDGHVHTTLQSSAGRCAVTVGWQGALPSGGVQLLLERHGARVAACAMVAAGDGRLAADLHVPSVDRWWPHTHGEPALHDVVLAWTSTDGMAARHVLQRVGFREVEMRAGADGRLRLAVNGVDVFARGACWMPIGGDRLHASRAAYEHDLAVLRDAGANMVRVSGATAYEHEAFHDACDAMGVMVWQDMMFANMDFPVDDPAFLAEVDAECADRLADWRGRPSLMVVCGNSEVEQQAAMWGADRAQWAPALFHERLAACVRRELPQAVWWPSSAHGGALPFDPAVGSTSYYGVGAYRQPLGEALAQPPSFATECLAFASIPESAGLAHGPDGALPPGPAWKAGVPRDLGAGWDFDDVRDHYVEQLYGEVPATLRATEPARYLELGRAAVAEVAARAFAHWRVTPLCGGAMVWTHRDLRPGAGWGLLDHQGRAKSIAHALGDVWQPKAVLVTEHGQQGVAIHVVNDGPQPEQGSIEVVLYREGAVQVERCELAVEVGAHATQTWTLQAALDHFVDLTWSYRFGPPPVDTLVAIWRNAAGAEVARVVHFVSAVHGPGRPLQRGDTGLQASLAAQSDDTALLSLRTTSAARGVHIDVTGWQAARNHFHLAPGATCSVQLRRDGSGTSRLRGAVSAINHLHPLAVVL